MSAERLQEFRLHAATMRRSLAILLEAYRAHEAAEVRCQLAGRLH